MSVTQCSSSLVQLPCFKHQLAFVFEKHMFVFMFVCFCMFHCLFGFAFNSVSNSFFLLQAVIHFAMISFLHTIQHLTTLTAHLSVTNLSFIPFATQEEDPGCASAPSCGWTPLFSAPLLLHVLGLFLGHQLYDPFYFLNFWAGLFLFSHESWLQLFGVLLALLLLSRFDSVA